MMRKRSSVVAAFALLASASFVHAADTPRILIGKGNAVPACVTPGHLMSFVTARNKALSPKFKDIAAAYQRHGEELHVRWDYAFYQMLVETNYLKFLAPGGRRGDVAQGQNNFAGLGATGHRNPGESFADVDTGVLAHLQHVRLYSGEPVENPVAERTKLVTDLILPWAQSLKHPVTFTDLTHKWAPAGHSYADAIEGTADLYRQAFCNGATAAEDQTAAADPAPAEPATETPAKAAGRANAKLAAAAQRATAPGTDEDQAVAAGPDETATLSGPALKHVVKAAVATVDQSEPADEGATTAVTDADVAQPQAPVVTKQAAVAKKLPATKLAVAATVAAPAAEVASEGTDIADASDQGDGGAVEVKAPVVKAPAAKVAAAAPAKTPKKAVVVASAADVPAAPAKTAAKPAKLEPTDTASTTTETMTEDAASNTQLASLTVPANPVATKNCKVFTASYGGGKSLLIQSLEGDHIRFTALTVNEAKAETQSKAFINIYAKGGQKIAEFGTQNEALTKAFQLCPEG